MFTVVDTYSLNMVGIVYGLLATNPSPLDERAVIRETHIQDTSQCQKLLVTSQKSHWSGNPMSARDCLSRYEVNLSGSRILRRL